MGIPEHNDENAESSVKPFIKSELKITREIELLKICRIVKESEGKIRPIIVRLEKPNDRQDVRRGTPGHLKVKPYRVNDQLPPEALRIHRELLLIHK